MIMSRYDPTQSGYGGLVPCRRVAPDRWRARRRARTQQVVRAQREAAARGTGPSRMEQLATGLGLQWAYIAALERRLAAQAAALADMQAEFDALERLVTALEANQAGGT